jgi:hypothetical protein
MEALLNDEFDLSEEEIISRVYGPQDGLNRLKFGGSTRAFYVDITDMEIFSNEKRLTRAVVHEIERRFKLAPDNPQALNFNDPEVIKITRHISAARRNKGPINMNNLLDQPDSAFGAHAKPVMQRIMDYFRKSHAPAVLHYEDELAACV